MVLTGIKREASAGLIASVRRLFIIDSCPSAGQFGRIKCYRCLVLASAVLALTLRATHIAHLHYALFTDMLAYWEADNYFWAMPCLPSRVLALTSLQPLYYLLCLFFREVFGPRNFYQVLWFQAFTDSLGCFLIAGIARRVYSARTAVIAAFVYALYAPSITESGYLLTESMSGLAVLVVIWLCIRALDRPSFRSIIPVAAVIAIVINLRSNLGVIAVPFVVMLVWNELKRRLPANRISAHVAAFVLVVALGTVPMTIRNSVIAGRFVFFVTNSSYNILVGTNPAALGDQAEWPQAWKEFMKDYQDDVFVRFQGYDNLVKYYVFTTHPGYVFSTLFPIKAKRIVLEPPVLPFKRNGPQGPDDLLFGPYVRIPVFVYPVVAVLGVVGLMMPCRRYRFFLLGTVVALFLPLLLVVVDNCYRYPLEPLLVVGTGAVIARCVFRTGFGQAFRISVTAYFILSGVWSAWSCSVLGGRNLLDKPQLKAQFPNLEKAIGSVLAIDSVGNDWQTTVVCEMPLNPAKLSRLLFKFQYQLMRTPENAKKASRYNEGPWPELRTKLEYFDDRGNTIPLNQKGREGIVADTFHYAWYLSHLQDTPGWQWKVVTLPGNAHKVRLLVSIQHPGTLLLWNLMACGPVWLKELP